MGLLSTIGAASGRAFGLTRVGAAIKDAYFNLTTLLLPGNGTNGAQNNTFLDSSSNNFSITRNGNTTQGTFTPFSQTGWSDYFDGTGYLTLPSVSTTFGTFSSSSTFTIEAWIYQTQRQSGAEPTLFGDMQATGGLSYFAFGPNNNGYLMLYWYSGGNATATTTQIPLNTWTHIACTVSSGAIKLFVNGILQTISGVSSFTAPAGSTGGLSIGRWNAGGSANGFFGYLSNLRVTNTALYSANFNPSTSPFTAISGTTLLTAQSNRFIDNSANNQIITVGNTPAVQAFSPFGPQYQYDPVVTGGSGYFDYSGASYLNTTTAATNYYSALGDWTWEAWVYPLSFSGPQYSCPIMASSLDSVILRATPTTASSTNLNMYAVNAAGSPILGSSGTSAGTITLNQWSHVVFQRRSGQFDMFLNGVRIANDATQTGTSLRTTDTAFLIGAGNSGSNPYWNGYISGVRVQNGSARYSGATITVPTAPPSPTGAAICANFTNAGVVDSTGKNDLETVGNAQISTAVKKWGSGSLYFNGTGSYLSNNAASQLYNFGTGDFTIEGWFYTGTGTNNAILHISDTAGGFKTSYANTIAIGLLSGKINLYGVAGTGITSTGTSYADSAWHHFALVRRNGVTKIYIDGTADTTVGTSGSITDTTSYAMQYIVVGGYYSTSYLWNGYVDDLRITRGYARYTANFTPPTAAFPDQ